MTPDEIVKKIVDAEAHCHEIYDEADKLSREFDSYIYEHVEKLRAERFKQAEAEIATAQKNEKSRADAAIEQMNDKLDYSLSKAKAVFESSRQSLVDKMYARVVDGDA